MNPEDRDETLPNDALPWIEQDTDGGGGGDSDDVVDRPASFVSISAGFWFGCGLSDRGAVDCWGRDDLGQASDPPGEFVGWSSGGYWACGVTLDGELVCQGDKAETRSEGVSLSDPVAVAVAPGGACALESSGAVVCWGSAPTPPEAWPAAREIAVGNRFVCSISEASDEVACFGRDTVLAPDALRAKALAAGDLHACALTLDDEITCWGEGGDDVLNAPDGPFVALDAQRAATCAVRPSGEVVCWGPGSEAFDAAEVAGAVQVTVGRDHACALGDEGIHCWGGGFYFQSSPPIAGVTLVDLALDRRGCAAAEDGLSCFGDGDVVSQQPPVGRVRALGVGEFHACAIAGDGSMACWGLDSNDRLAFPEGVRWLDVAVDNGGSCGVRENGALTCWGGRYGGESLGSEPHLKVAAGSDHVVALRADGGLTCLGAQDARCEPPQGAQFDDVAAGGDNTCGVARSGALACFGLSEPVLAVPEGLGWRSVTVGDDHACALDQAGAVTCWGEDSEGETVSPGGTFTALSTSAQATCGVREDGTLVCWGLRAR